MKLFDDILNLDLFLQNAQLLKNKKFKAGVDHMTANEAYSWLQINGAQLLRRLKRGSYEPAVALTYTIAKQSGGYRRVGKLTAIDTVIQHVIMDVVSPYLEKQFSDSSHAYRKNRSVETAVNQYCTYGTEHSVAVKIDPVSCFDNVNHAILNQMLNEMIGDEKLVALMMEYVGMPVLSEGEMQYPEKGILQGAPLSNLFCNIYLHKLDIYLEECNIPFVRYADDLVLFFDTMTEAKMKCERTLSYLEQELFLKKNAKKCKIDAPVNLRYLGYCFQNSRYGLRAFDADWEETDVFRNWENTTPRDMHRTVDVLKDGILRQKDYSLLFDGETEDFDIPIASTEIINIYASVIFDSGFLQKAMERGIQINLYDRHASLIGRFYPNAPLKSPVMTFEQLNFYYSERERLALASTFVLTALHHMKLNVRYYNKFYPDKYFGKIVTAINELEKEIKECPTHEKLLLLEARTREAYYSCFDRFIHNKDFVFEKRTKRPPQNEINALISFGNTLLYNLFATEIYKSPLDIRIGFLHATNNRKESLNLDFAEIYKPLVVDRVIFALINRRVLNTSHFEKTENGGVYLNAEGKRIFLDAFYEKLDTSLQIKGEHLTYRELIKREVPHLIRYFRHSEKYKPFKQVK